VVSPPWRTTELDPLHPSTYPSSSAGRWDNNIPSNCKMGCEIPGVFMTDAIPYTTVNYGFTLLTTNPDPSKARPYLLNC
jgi:hypothetical protein